MALVAAALNLFRTRVRAENVRPVVCLSFELLDHRSTASVGLGGNDISDSSDYAVTAYSCYSCSIYTCYRYCVVCLLRSLKGDLGCRLTACYRVFD